MHVKQLFKQSYPPISGACFMDGRKFTGWIYVVCEKAEQWVKGKKCKIWAGQHFYGKKTMLPAL